MTRYTKAQLNEILRNHYEWLQDNKKGERAILTNVDFDGMKLKNINFCWANLAGSKFTHCKLSYVNFKNATIRDCDFDYALVDHCDFLDSDKRGVNFDLAHLISVRLGEDDD